MQIFEIMLTYLWHFYKLTLDGLSVFKFVFYDRWVLKYIQHLRYELLIRKFFCYSLVSLAIEGFTWWPSYQLPFLMAGDNDLKNANILPIFIHWSKVFLYYLYVKNSLSYMKLHRTVTSQECPTSCYIFIMLGLLIWNPLLECKNHN